MAAMRITGNLLLRSQGFNCLAFQMPELKRAIPRSNAGQCRRAPQQPECDAATGIEKDRKPERDLIAACEIEGPSRQPGPQRRTHPRANGDGAQNSTEPRPR